MSGESDLAATERELVITRVFNSPSELVFRAFTEIEMALKWMGPRDFPMTFLEGDLRPGGKWRGCLTGAGGERLWQGGEWREINPPKRLVFTFGWDNPDRTSGPEMLITIDFAQQDGKTLMTFRQAPFDTVANRDGHRGGWNSAFDRLDEYLIQSKGGEIRNGGRG